MNRLTAIIVGLLAVIAVLAYLGMRSDKDPEARSTPPAVDQALPKAVLENGGRAAKEEDVAAGVGSVPDAPAETAGASRGTLADPIDRGPEYSTESGSEADRVIDPAYAMPPLEELRESASRAGPGPEQVNLGLPGPVPVEVGTPGNAGPSAPSSTASARQTEVPSTESGSQILESPAEGADGPSRVDLGYPGPGEEQRIDEEASSDADRPR